MSIRRSSPIAVVICTALTLLSLAAVGEAGEKLTMKFREGETFTYRISQNMTIEMESAGVKSTLERGQTLFVKRHVKSVAEDESASVEQTIERVQMKLVLPPPVSQTVEYDSNSEDEPSHPIAKQMAQGASAMIGEVIAMTVTNKGQTKDVVIPEKLQQSPAEGAAMGGGDQLRQMIEKSGLPLPDGEVSPDDSWDQELQLDSPIGTVNITNTFTYVGQNNDGLHKIDSTMDVQFTPKDDTKPAVTPETKEAGGSFLFDNEAGRLQQSTVKQVQQINDEGGEKRTITILVTMALMDESE